MVKLVQARDSDGPFLGRVCRSVAPVYDQIMPGAFAKQAVKYEEKGLPRGYEVLLVQVADRPIGFVGLTAVNEEIVYLVALYLLREEQGRGYGRQVVELVKETYGSQGYHEMVLLAHQQANWAIGFYQAIGFQVAGRREEEIRGYQGGVLEGYSLPGTVLMRCEW